MANGVNRRNGNGNGQFSTEFNNEENWWDGTTTDPNTVPDAINPPAVLENLSIQNGQVPIEEEGEFPIEEEAADPFAQFQAQMKTPEYLERMVEQARNRNYIGGWRGGPLTLGPIQRNLGPVYGG